MDVCNTDVWHGLDNLISSNEGVELSVALSEIATYERDAILFAGKHGCKKNVLYCVIQRDEDFDIITRISYFKDTYLSDDDMDYLIQKLPDAEFGILYAERYLQLCKKAWKEEKSKHIGPITLKDANAFVKANHRHHDSVTGCKFAIGLYKKIEEKDALIGTAICGRPVSRMLDDGYTLEINRLCVTEQGNSCSMLYGACCRIAKEMGYKKVITYILESESGTSLKASNFILEDAFCGGKNWSGKRKRKNNKVLEEMKQRWIKIIKEN